MSEYEPTEGEDWAAMDQHLTKVYHEEEAKLLSSFAVNQTFKENGTMQEINRVTMAQSAKALESEVGSAWLEGQDMLDVLAQPTQELQAAKAQEIIGRTDEKALSPDLAAAFLQAKESLGGDEVVVDSLSDVVAATADGTTIKPPTKKQLKAMKHMQKNMQSYMKKAQKQAQTQHILNKLYTHSIRTPEQARQIHAAQLAKAEIIEKLGQRQADAFFAAKPGTKCHDFFPKATIAANPSLMTSVNGESRTLEQVYEYFIYKQFMLLTKKAEVPFEGDLNTSVDWANTEVKPYVVYEGADAVQLDQQAQGDIVEEAQTEAAESSYTEEEDLAA